MNLGALAEMGRERLYDISLFIPEEKPFMCLPTRVVFMKITSCKFCMVCTNALRISGERSGGWTSRRMR